MKINFCSAVFARTLQAIITNPVYVIKIRFEVVGFNEYSNIFDAIRKIYISEGLRGFMVGLKVGCLRDVPFTGIYYPIYEEMKHLYAMLFNLQKLKEDKHNDKLNLMILSS